MLWWIRYKRRLGVLETGGGWFVERDGRRVAVLTDPRFEDMFWYAWHLAPLVEDPEEREVVRSQAFWENDLLSRTVFRSREYGTVGDGFWAGREPLRDGRLVMRGLYQPVSGPWPWDWAVLKVQELFRRKRV